MYLLLIWTIAMGTQHNVLEGHGDDISTHACQSTIRVNKQQVSVLHQWLLIDKLAKENQTKQSFISPCSQIVLFFLLFTFYTHYQKNIFNLSYSGEKYYS